MAARDSCNAHIYRPSEQRGVANVGGPRTGTLCIHRSRPPRQHEARARLISGLSAPQHPQGVTAGSLRPSSSFVRARLTTSSKCQQSDPEARRREGKPSTASSTPSGFALISTGVCISRHKTHRDRLQMHPGPNMSAGINMYPTKRGTMKASSQEPKFDS